MTGLLKLKYSERHDCIYITSPHVEMSNAICVYYPASDLKGRQQDLP